MLRIILALIASGFFYLVYLLTDINVMFLTVIVVGAGIAHLITWNKVPIIPDSDASIRMGKDYSLPIILVILACAFVILNVLYQFSNWRF